VFLASFGGKKTLSPKYILVLFWHCFGAKGHSCPSIFIAANTHSPSCPDQHLWTNVSRTSHYYVHKNITAVVNNHTLKWYKNRTSGEMNNNKKNTNELLILLSSHRISEHDCRSIRHCYNCKLHVLNSSSKTILIYKSTETKLNILLNLKSKQQCCYRVLSATSTM